MPPSTVAIVPLKALSLAKTRLALPPRERRALARLMALRVLDACAAVVPEGGVLLVAGDAAAATVGRERGVEVLVPDAPGLQAALDAADATALVRGAARSLVVAADLPLARPRDLERMLDAARDHLPARGASPRLLVVVAPTRDGGTGALLRAPAGAIATAYGPDSAARHLRLAATAGLPARRVEVPGLALDVDSLADLDDAGQRDPRVARWRADLAGGRLPA